VSVKVFDRTLDAIAKSLDLRVQRQGVISSNIANAETPGYQAQRLDFEESLQRALDMDDAPMLRTDPGHMTSGGEVLGVEPEVYNNPNNVVREDGNTVDRDAEMFALSENQIQYNAAIELLKKKVGLLKYSINEGGR
jgi:flagellar basal-body rod protein FlgB